MSNDIHIPTFFAVLVLGNGEPSDSGWNFGSECGSVAVSGVPVVTDSDSEWEFVESQSFSFSKKRKFACVENQEDINYEGTLVQALPCRKRWMRTPLPQQSSFSPMEEGSPWSAEERTPIARMEQYVNNSDCIKLEIDEVEDCSLGLEYSGVDVKHILRNATREGRNMFEVF